jgi:hypothetical protein
MSDMIYRAEDDDDDQAHIPHATLWDHRLSVRARGLLAMLLCLRPGGGVSMVALAREMRDVGGRAVEGRDALRAARRELEQVGYLVATQDRDNRGQWTTLTRVYRRPRRDAGTTAQASKPQVSPGPENPAPGEPAPGNPAQASKPQVSPGPENPAPGEPAPGNPAVSSSTSTRRDDDEERTRARVQDPLVNGGPVLRALDDALRVAGIEVSWSVSGDDLVTIEDLAATRGVGRLVAAAARQVAAQPAPPNYVTAFVRRWRGLRPVAATGPAHAVATPADRAELAELEARLRDHAARLDVPEGALRRRAREALVANGYAADVTAPAARLDIDRMAVALAESTPGAA